jgi:16S rRNA (cytosine967-C5)-methyltransferase
VADAATPARRAAYEVVRRVFEHGAWADRALPAAIERAGVTPRNRAQAQWLAYGAVQRRGTTDALIERLSGREPDDLDAPVLAALRLGLFEVLYGDGAAHAAVDGAVELAKGGMRRVEGKRARGAAGFVNALLRRAARERDRLLAGLGDETPAAAAVAHSAPRWLAELWWRELGPEAARALLRASNEAGETGLRVNLLRAEPAGVSAELEAAGVELVAPRPGSLLWPPEALAVRGALPEAVTTRLRAGELFAQSRAAQAVVALLAPQPGERVLDLCAGPGIKTTAIAARMRNEGEVVAVEIDAGRARQIEELCERAGARNVRVVRADAARDDIGDGYDRVLVDPPCSDLGTLAGRPDARWRKQPATLAQLAELQGALLAAGAHALRPGGTLVYSTCTISRAENEGVVTAALERDSALAADELGELEPALASPHDRRFLQSRPDRDGTDGFFYARVRRDG